MKRRTYNRYLPTNVDQLDVAWKGLRAGALTEGDVLSIQTALVPDCEACGLPHTGQMTVEKRRLCLECFREELTARMGKRG